MSAPTATPRSRTRGTGVAAALPFLLPALVILGALVLYPIIATVVRSLYDRAGDGFVGLDNYSDALTSDSTQRALENNLIWVVVAPAVVTALGLVFAVLAERVKWSTAFKTIVFMPMAISFLAAGVIFRLVYEEAPERGLANAALTTVTGIFQGPGDYVGARVRDDSPLEVAGDGFRSTGTYSPGDEVVLPLVGLRAEELPDDAAQAARPDAGGDALTGVVWSDFQRGGGGEGSEQHQFGL